MRLLDLFFVASVVFAFVFIADVRATSAFLPWLEHDRIQHLGAENNEIAVALRKGRGFSDPFRSETGPTAWMPPVLPYFTAGLYWLTGGQKTSVVEIIVILKFLTLVFTGMLLVGQARKLGRSLSGYAVLVVGLAANFHELFQKTHDTWLLLLLVNLLWIGSCLLARSRQAPQPSIWWGAFGGVVALSSPIVGATWALITMVIWWPRRSYSKPQTSPRPHSMAGQGVEHTDETTPRLHSDQSRPFVALLFSAVMSMLVVTPWTIRNRIVLGEWMPIKSNGMYELWQSQCLDDDGILDSSTTSLHPWTTNGPQRKRYQELGEVAFVSEKGKEARASIIEQPSEYAIRVLNRAAAACVYYVPFKHDQKLSGWPMRFKRLVFPSPLVGLLIVLALRPTPLKPEVYFAIAICVLVLVPYVLVSYYDRYAAPLVGMKMLLILYGLDTLLRTARTVTTHFRPHASLCERSMDAARIFRQVSLKNGRWTMGANICGCGVISCQCNVVPQPYVPTMG